MNIKIRLIGILFSTFFLALALLIGYKIYFFWSFVYFFYLVPTLIFLAVGLYVTFISKKEDSIRSFLIFIFSIFFSLCLMEFFLIKTDNLKFFKRYADSKKHKINYDFRRKIDVVRQTSGSVPSMHVFTDRHINVDAEKLNIIPISGVSNAKTILCNENGFWVKYQSDRYGFRNDNMVWDENEIEYLVIGDSFAHGACINDENTISSNLSKLSKKKSINLGIGGNGPILHYASIKEFGVFKKPKKIIWMFNVGDFLYDFENEIENKILINYLNNENYRQNLKERTATIDKIYENIIDNYLKNFFFLKFINTRTVLNKFNAKLKKDSSKKIAENDQKNNIKKFIKITKMIKKLSNTNNSKLYFVYTPLFAEYSENFKKQNTFQYENFLKYKSIIMNIIKEENINIIDLHQLKWIKDKDPIENYVFKRQNHYTPEIYNEISEIIFLNSKN